MPSRTPAVRTALLLIALVLVPLPLGAHTLFFHHDAGVWHLVRGHPGERETAPCREVDTIRIWIVTADSLLPLATTPPADAAVPDSVLPPAAVGLLAEVDWGVWTKTPDGARHAPPDSVAEPLESWHSRETILQLLRPTAAPPLLGRNLEIRPLDPPARWRRGHKLRVRLTRDGRPAAGVTVAYGHRARGATGRDGELNVRLRHAGWQVITGSLRLPPSAGSPVGTVLSATLLFPLEERP